MENLPARKQNDAPPITTDAPQTISTENKRILGHRNLWNLYRFANVDAVGLAKSVSEVTLRFSDGRVLTIPYRSDVVFVAILSENLTSEDVGFFPISNPDIT